MLFYLRNRFAENEKRRFDPANTCALHIAGLRFRARFCDWLAVIQFAELKEYDFIDSLFEPGARPVMADLGANIGLFSMKVFSRWPGARIHAVEPGENTFAVLEQNLKLNPGLQWSAHHAAVWSEDDELLFDNRYHSTNSRVAFSGGGNEKVDSITPRTLIERHIKSDVDFMKMDIEGAELATLESDPGILDRVAVLFVEIHPKLCDAKRVVEIIRGKYEFIYGSEDRHTAKPYIIATRRPLQMTPFDDV